MGIVSTFHEILKEQLVSKNALNRSNEESKHVEVFAFRTLQCSDQELCKRSPFLQLSDLHDGTVVVHEVFVVYVKFGYLGDGELI